MSSSSYFNFFDQGTQATSVPYSAHTDAPIYGEKISMIRNDERRTSQNPVKPIFSKEQIQKRLVHGRSSEGCQLNSSTSFGPNFPFASEDGAYGAAFDLDTPPLEQSISPVANGTLSTGAYTASRQTKSVVNTWLSSLRTSSSAPDAQTMNLDWPTPDPYEDLGSDADAEGETDLEFEQEDTPGFTNLSAPDAQTMTLGCPTPDQYGYPGSDVDAEDETDSEFEREDSPGFTSETDDYSQSQQTASCTGKSSTPSIRTLRSQKAGSSFAHVSAGVQRTRPSSRKTGGKPYSVPSRTKQVPGPFVKLFPSVRKSGRCPLCPETVRRPDDLDRHYRGHFQSPPTAICNGVRIERAAEYGIDVATSEVEEFDGVFRVGVYCRAAFTRKDALVRHLKNPKFPCVGDIIPAAAYAGIKDL
ncbi:hypothetical protein PHLGIDRAFT_238039 [Phlebiopsis gigantea 11061_1 CR5-6]|uniref:C2H2-type domain-containing protein n=1 Tax=Phlebiopsis gigantea (strain 11061_1 CR5-6) TaxID=745531 RepID=A0A0C3S1Z5_PHLG1|nr:hypothetical protein PHLGIDRAFT_238039 [Phlebiopsis gigantea 11061_1 CR5-6]